MNRMNVNAFEINHELEVMDFDKLDADEILFRDLWGRDTKDKTSLKVAYDKKYIYFLFRSEIVGELPEKYNRKGGKVFRSDCTELFIGFDGCKNHYYELDISPYNKKFIAYITNVDNCVTEVKPLKDLNIHTDTQIREKYYDTLYALPVKEIVQPNEKISIFFNAFRVILVDGKKKRISRSLAPTNSISHHILESFVDLYLQ